MVHQVNETTALDRHNRKWRTVCFKAYVGFWFVLFLVAFYPVFIILNRGESPFRKLYWFVRILSKIVLRLCFLRVKVEIKGKVPPAPFLIAPNHSSYLDILSIYAIFPQYTIFIGKSELLKVPLFNIFFKKMNIPVIRGDPISAATSYARACEEIKKGACVVVFPEGTIPRCAPFIGPLKEGAFKLSLETGIPIVPVVFPWNWKRMGGHTLTDGIASPGTIKAIIGHPIYPSPDTTIEELKGRWKQFIEKEILEHNRIGAPDTEHSSPPD